MVRGNSRRRALIGVAVVLVVLAPVLLLRWWPNDSSASIDDETALERYRDRASTTLADDAVAADDTDPPTTTAAPADAFGVSLPTPGVWRYATSGFETTDVLGGARHDYPAETFITVVRGDCGIQVRWDLLVERYEEWTLCVRPEGVVLMPTSATYHEFFTTGRREELSCDREVLLVPVDRQPRPLAQLECVLDGRAWLPAWEVVEFDTRTVDGVEVEVVHVRMTVVNESVHYEYTTVDWWLDATGLPVAMSATKESNTDSGVIGDVVYTETFDAALTSLTPIG